VSPDDLFLPTELIRRIDAAAVGDLGIPGLLLMENAARCVCDAITRRGPWNSITILCGHGNNGGDGLAVARLLAAININSRVCLIAGEKSLSSDAQANLSFLTNSGLSVDRPEVNALDSELKSLTPQDLIVDALLGTGIRGTVASPLADVIGSANASPAIRLAIDVPSGLDSETGLPCGIAIRANLTVTFVAKKRGFQRPESREYTGAIEVGHIGLPESWIRRRFL
jgi:hydroxyethylthiazole kinase-like uncharacterized protein yjeF